MGLRACEKGSPICMGYFNKEEEIVVDPRCLVLAKKRCFALHQTKY